MKKNDIKKLKEKAVADLMKELAEAKDGLREMKFQLAEGKIKNVRLINETKKKIARILTFVQTKLATENNDK